jgi:hypothetical protein
MISPLSLTPKLLNVSMKSGTEGLESDCVVVDIVHETDVMRCKM